DTVREELQTKIAPLSTPRFEKGREPRPISKPLTELPQAAVPPRIAAPSSIKRVETLELTAPKTSPTLVGFQNKSATLPEWRLQLQNAVQQRRGNRSGLSTASPVVQTQYPSHGATALKAEPAPTPMPKVENKDPRVA